MGNYLNTCNGIKSVSIIKSTTKSDLPLNNKTIIRLILVGLDNSGKTSTALHLLKKPLEDVIPTLGFNSYTLDSPGLNKNKDAKVELIDLGGSEKIRKLWEDYYPSAHGLICLLDSADTKRFKEIKTELEKILSNKNVQGKPLLVLLNKMDLDDAMDEVEICNEINIEQLVNDNKCPTKIEQCAVRNKNTSNPAANTNQKKKKIDLDAGIEQGFSWIVNYILNNWEKLDERVRTETEKVEKQNKEKMDALREKYKNKNGETNGEADANEEEIKGNPFKPIEEVVKEIEKKERTKNGTKEDSVKSKTTKVDAKKEETLTKSRSRNKLTEKILEVKKKAAVVRQSKVADKSAQLEKQDSKQDLKADLKEENNKENNKESKDNDLKEVKEAEKTEEKPVDEKPNEMSQNSTATNSIDTVSNDTVIEVKK